MRIRSLSATTLVLLTALSAGCGLLKKPDMSRTSGIARLNKPRNPLILLHGFLGSKLRDARTHRVVWGNMTNVLRGGDTDDLALPLEGFDAARQEDTLEPYQIYDKLWGRDFYGEILRSLTTAGGYQIGDIEHPRPGDNAFVFVYDWRRDLVESAGLLAAAIDRLKLARGRPGERFDLLAHSQGGLIARYYVKYGGVDVIDGEAPRAPTMVGAAHVDKVILMGTPNRGCLESLKILHLGVKKVFRPMRPEVVFTMPAVYQMLPPRGTILFADTAGGTVDIDVYDADAWVREGWSRFSPEARKRLDRRPARSRRGREAINDAVVSREFLARQLKRADRLHRALDAPAGAAPEVAYYAFGGDCANTLKTAIVTRERGRQHVLFDGAKFKDERVAAILAGVLYGPGDGTVLMQSLLAIPDGKEGTQESSMNFKSAFFVCGSHGVLANDPIFQNNLLYLLLWNGSGPPGAVLAGAR